MLKKKFGLRFENYKLNEWYLYEQMNALCFVAIATNKWMPFSPKPRTKWPDTIQPRWPVTWIIQHCDKIEMHVLTTKTIPKMNGWTPGFGLSDAPSQNFQLTFFSGIFDWLNFDGFRKWNMRKKVIEHFSSRSEMNIERWCKQMYFLGWCNNNNSKERNVGIKIILYVTHAFDVRFECVCVKWHQC